MIRYYCDRCELEVEGQNDLLAFASEVGDGVTSSAWRMRRELCQKCVDEAKDMVTKFFGKTSGARRRTA
ncbi:MAG TPA: hypothetical protein VMT89_15680 [Candidatus Acidoferrales bacterium]|nr:hypothetical protein [Candidatus Acidoferrales bacterium]